MDCMKELMKYSYMLIYKVGEYTEKIRDEELKDIIQ
ncbi:TPA: spore coat protein, partial [Bacillus toyonensis]|nr:spore coat protein [Bacillus toyonensis]